MSEVFGTRAGPLDRFTAHGVLITVIAVTCAFATAREPVFVSPDNVREILLATATAFIVACGLALLMIAGGIDVSLGANFTVGAIAACALMRAGVPWPLAVIAGLAAAAAVGMLSGLVIARLGVPPIIATLSMFFIASGLVSFGSKGLIVRLPEGFLRIGQGSVLGVPNLALLALAVGVASWVALERTAYGLNLRAIGGNRAAASAVGIRIQRTEVALYALCGAAAGLGGILYASRTAAGQPDAGGFGLTLQVLTAVLVGGVSLAGGRGSIGGVGLGCLLFAVLSNALGIVQFDQVLSEVVIGLVLVIAVAFDGFRRRRRVVDLDSGAPEPSVNRTELQRLMTEGAQAEAVRIADAIARERRRIERDLHDGAQQQLVSAMMLLERAGDGAAPDSRFSALLDETTTSLRSALRELRDLSRGLYPTVMESHGLVAAIRSLTQGSVLRVELTADEIPRMDETTELCAYFVIAEAMTNVLKHAPHATLKIRLAYENETLAVVISDDGDGGADPARGSGLAGLSERVNGAGGTFVVVSPDGAGTQISVTIPAAVRGFAASESRHT